MKKFLASLLLCASLSGCGTLSQNCLRPYGGTAIDLVYFVYYFPIIPIQAFFLADLPFSFLADTIILPFAISNTVDYEIRNH